MHGSEIAIGFEFSCYTTKDGIEDAKKMLIAKINERLAYYENVLTLRRNMLMGKGFSTFKPLVEDKISNRLSDVKTLLKDTKEEERTQQLKGAQSGLKALQYKVSSEFPENDEAFKLALTKYLSFQIDFCFDISMYCPKDLAPVFTGIYMEYKNLRKELLFI